MPAAGTTVVRTKRDKGLVAAQLFEDGYENHGWICWKCSHDNIVIKQYGFRNRDSARRAAAKHEVRRGHR